MNRAQMARPTPHQPDGYPDAPEWDPTCSGWSRAALLSEGWLEDARITNGKKCLRVKNKYQNCRSKSSIHILFAHKTPNDCFDSLVHIYSGHSSQNPNCVAGTKSNDGNVAGDLITRSALPAAQLPQPHAHGSPGSHGISVPKRTGGQL